MEFLDGENVKPVFASASPKHTLVLDSDSQMWYFGDKSAVGIKDKKDKYQFSPKKLQPLNENGSAFIETKFRYLAAGPNINIAITMKSGQPFQFGHDILKAQEEAAKLLRKKD